MPKKYCVMYLLLFVLYGSITTCFSIKSNGTLTTDANSKTEQNYSSQDPANVGPRKCCPHNYVYLKAGEIGSAPSCILYSENQNYTFAPQTFINKIPCNKTFSYRREHWNCNESNDEIMLNIDEFPLFLQRDGRLLAIIRNEEIYFGPDKYCIEDYFSNKSAPPVLSADVCWASERKTDSNWKGICMLVSCFFLLLTVIANIISKTYKKFYGKLRITYVLCYFVAFLFLATSQIGVHHMILGTLFCSFSVHIIYFTMLAAFFWLNVMCWEIWITFSKPFSRSNNLGPEVPYCYLKCCLFAFGVPALLLIFFIGMEYSNLSYTNPLKYSSTTQGCFFRGYTKLIYVYTPILISCAANLAFFIMSVIEVNEMTQQGRRCLLYHDNVEVQKEIEKERFWMCIRLFILMGLSWILEVIAFFMPTFSILWNITDGYNALMGCTIFLIYSLTKTNKNKIVKWYKQRKGQTLERHGTPSTTTSRITNSFRDEVQLSKIQKTTY